MVITKKKKAVQRKKAQKKTVQKMVAQNKTAKKKAVQKKSTMKKTARKAVADKTAGKKKTVKKGVTMKTVQKKTIKKKTLRKRIAGKGPVDIKRLKRRPPVTAIGKSTIPDTGGIPHGYNEDTIVMMPINSDTGFIYWEITERLLKRKLKKSHIGSTKLIIRVFEEDSRKEVYSFDISDRVGKRYMKYRGSLRPLIAEMGILKGSTFTGLLRSNPVTMPSSAGKTADDEIWMRKIKNTFEIVRMPAAGADAELQLRLILAKYYLEALGSWSSSLFGSPFMSSS
jgi:hypothetical protein